MRIAIAVVKDGKVVHSKGYGVTSIETKQKVDENTLFAIGSNTKAFTSAALAILVDENKLTWYEMDGTWTKGVDISGKMRRTLNYSFSGDYIFIGFPGLGWVSSKIIEELRPGE